MKVLTSSLGSSLGSRCCPQRTIAHCQTQIYSISLEHCLLQNHSKALCQLLYCALAFFLLLRAWFCSFCRPGVESLTGPTIALISSISGMTLISSFSLDKPSGAFSRISSACTTAPVSAISNLRFEHRFAILLLSMVLINSKIKTKSTCTHWTESNYLHVHLLTICSANNTMCSYTLQEFVGANLSCGFPLALAPRGQLEAILVVLYRWDGGTHRQGMMQNIILHWLTSQGIHLSQSSKLLFWQKLYLLLF